MIKQEAKLSIGYSRSYWFTADYSSN